MAAYWNFGEITLPAMTCRWVLFPNPAIHFEPMLQSGLSDFTTSR